MNAAPLTIQRMPASLHRHRAAQFILSLLLGLCLPLIIHSQPPTWFVVFQGIDASPPALDLTTQSTVARITSSFGIDHITVIRYSTSEGGMVYGSYDEGLQLLREQVNLHPTEVVCVVFDCSPGKGPELQQISTTLNNCTGPLKILSNAYYRSDLRGLSQEENCRNALSVIDFAQIHVIPDDTIIQEDKMFPVIPVVIGATGLATGGILIFRDRSEDCTPVTAAWSFPSGVCENDGPVQLAVTGTPGGTWSGPGVNASGVFDPSDGSRNITYTVGDADCEMSLTQTVPVEPQADATWPSPGELCTSTPAALIPSGTPGGSWSGDGVTDNGDGTGVFETATPGIYSITYMAGQGTCADAVTREVTVLELGDPSWTPPDNVCVNESVTLAPGGTSGGTWAADGVTDNGDGTATFVQDAAGTYSVTYTVGEGECQASETQSINVIEQADASWTVPASPCPGVPVDLAPDGTPGGMWSGEGITDLGNGTAAFTGEQPGDYSITYSAGSGNCADTVTQSITVLPAEDASWDNPGSLCTGDVVTLTPAGTPGGMWSGEGITDLGNGTATFSQKNTGSYPVTYVTTGMCADTVVQQITVVSQGDASWTSPANLCPGEEVILTPDESQGGTWSGDGVTDLGNGTATFSSDEAGSHTVTYTVGQGSCADTLTQDITVDPQDDATWTVPDPVCTGSAVQLIPDGTQGGIWSGDGVTDLGNGMASFNADVAGEYAVTYTTIGSCTDTSTQTISVNEQGDAAWTPPSDPPCVNQEIILTPDGTQGGFWSGDGVTDLGDGTALFSGSSAGNYFVIYTAGEPGCEDEVTQEITVEPLPEASWTPDSDMLCPGEVLPLFAPDGTWSGDGVTDFGNGQGEFVSETPGVFTITLTVGEGDCQSSESHDVSVGDNEAPVITVPPTDMFVECDGTGNLADLQAWVNSNGGGGQAFDACGGDVTWIPDVQDPGGTCREIPVVFDVCDDADNCTNVQAVFHVEDTEPPILFGVPPPETVQCDDIPPPADVSADDICSGPLAVSFDEIIGSGCPYTITRIYSATDDCGNVTEEVQVLTVEDNVAPVGDPLPPLDLVCDFPCGPECLPPPQPVNFTDNCDETVDVTFEDNPIDIQPEFQIWERTYIGTDECGNQGFIVQLIQIQCIMTEPQLTVITGDPILSATTLGGFPTVTSFWKDHGAQMRIEKQDGQVFRMDQNSTGLSVRLGGRSALQIRADQTFARGYFTTEATNRKISGELRSTAFLARMKQEFQESRKIYVASGLLVHRVALHDLVWQDAINQGKLSGHAQTKWFHSISVGMHWPLQHVAVFSTEGMFIHDLNQGQLLFNVTFRTSIPEGTFSTKHACDCKE